MDDAYAHFVIVHKYQPTHHFFYSMLGSSESVSRMRFARFASYAIGNVDLEV